MTSFMAAAWKEILQFNQLDSFDSLWNLQADWFEAPNRRRGGWSGVSRLVLPLPTGGETVVFLKRQENHSRRTLWHPIRGIPTFRAEIKSILRLRQLNVPTMEPVYYAEHKKQGSWRSILVTRELSGYQSLEAVVAYWHHQGWQKYRGERNSILRSVAAACAHLHRHRLVHMALYAKHLFVNRETAAVCFIDLEKMRASLSARRAMLRDLDSLNRHVEHFSRTDRLRFLQTYFGVGESNDRVRRAWSELMRMERRKMAQKNTAVNGHRPAGE